MSALKTRRETRGDVTGKGVVFFDDSKEQTSGGTEVVGPSDGSSQDPSPFKAEHQESTMGPGNLLAEDQPKRLLLIAGVRKHFNTLP